MLCFHFFILYFKLDATNAHGWSRNIQMELHKQSRVIVAPWKSFFETLALRSMWAMHKTDVSLFPRVSAMPISQFHSLFLRL